MANIANSSTAPACYYIDHGKNSKGHEEQEEHPWLPLALSLTSEPFGKTRLRMESIPFVGADVRVCLCVCVGECVWCQVEGMINMVVVLVGSR